MTPESVVGLLAEPLRLRVFSAAVLGAATIPEIVKTAGVTHKDAAAALRRLIDGGLIEETGNGVRARSEEFKEIARAAQYGRPAEEFGSGDEGTEELLRRFVRNGRLVGLPAQSHRREVILRYFVKQSFEPGVTYSETAVNNKLREWCEGTRVDHVSIRRYLINLRLLGRENNRYWLHEMAKPAV